MITGCMKWAVLGLGLLGAAAVPAQAGVYSDEMSKCLVKSMSPADQSTFIIWIFSAMALHPDVAPYATFTAAQHETIDHKAAALVERMLTVDCRKETVDALKYEGANSMETSFETVGQVAMRGLTSDPAVAAGTAKFGSYFDESKMHDLFKDAGIAPSPGH